MRGTDPVSPIGRRGGLFPLAGLFLVLVACVTTGGGAQAAGRPVLRVAHRGGAGLAPENTMASFRKGLEFGADAVELDVHLSSDGELVVMHDPNVARTTDGSGEIAGKSLAEIRTLDASARWFGVPVGTQAVPTLQEVLDLVKGRCGVQIEIKVRADGSRYAGIERKVVEAVKRTGMADRVVVLSFNYPTLVDVKAVDPGIRTCALVNKASLTAIGKGGTAAGAEMKRIGADLVGVDKAVLTTALYAELRAAGLGVGVWTVDDEKLMRQFAAMGVDFIISNRPDLLRSEFPSGRTAP